MKNLISEKIEEIRIELDSIIKLAAEKYGINEECSQLCESKDRLGQIQIPFRELEAK